MIEKKQRGGAREGAGRPRLNIKNIQVRITMPIDLINTLKKLGGSRWVQQQIIKTTLNDQ